MTSELSASLWYDTTRERQSAPALIGDIQADLVVIGGGYTGLSAALQAASHGADVCLLEASEFGAGGSGRNVGLVNAGLWLPPEDINAQIGVAAGERLSRILAAGPDAVFDLIRTHDIQCEAVRSGTLHCAHAPRGYQALEDRCRQYVDRGAPVQLLSADDAVRRVGSLQVHGALFDPRAGTIQPLAYAKGLARAARSAGARLYESSPAVALEKTGERWTVSTAHGSVTARYLILATNAYLSGLTGLKETTIVPVHYFQAATDPLPAKILENLLPGKEGCWDTALVMSSWRLDQAGRLIIGGMGELEHFAGAAHRGWLERKLARVFPELAGTPLNQTWFGRIAMTLEHLPKILALDPTALVAFGYSGRGIGPGTVFGQRMADALLSRDNSVLPVAPVTEHSLPFAGLRQWYYEFGATVTHLVADRG